MDSYDVLLLPERRFLAQIAVEASGEHYKNIFHTTPTQLNRRSAGKTIHFSLARCLVVCLPSNSLGNWDRILKNFQVLKNIFL